MNPQFLTPATEPASITMRLTVDQPNLATGLYGLPIWVWLLVFFAAGYWLCVSLELIDLRRGALRRRTTPGTGRDLTDILPLAAARRDSTTQAEA